MDFEDVELVGTGDRRCLGLLRVQAVKLRVVMKRAEVGVAASPHRVPEPCFPGFTKGIQGFRLSFQAAVQTSRVVKNRGFVSAQGNSEDRVFRNHFRLSRHWLYFFL